MAKSVAKGSRAGRNKVKCERYRAAGKREKNKERRAAKRARTLEKRRTKRELDAMINTMISEEFEFADD